MVLAGEGGQGVQSVAKILVEAGYEIGKEVLYIPISRCRTKRRCFYCILSDCWRINRRTPLFQSWHCNYALRQSDWQMCNLRWWEHNSYLRLVGLYKKTWKPCKRLIEIPANKIANEQLSSRVFNIIILGALISATNVLEVSDIKNAMEMALGKKFAAKPELRDLNYKALEMGMDLISKAAV